MEYLDFINEKINGVNVHYLQTDKFKTNFIIFNIVQNLSEESATKTALLAYILKRGSKEYPSIKSLYDRLDNLYGALLNVFVFKRGEKQVVQFSIEVANEKYLSKNVNLLFDSLQVISQIIANPLVINQGFKKEYLAIEKELMANRITGILDDKIRYAEFKTIEHMCKNEPYRLLAYGRKQDLDHITETALYNYYQEWLQGSQMDVYLVGDFIMDNISKVLNNTLDFNGGQIKLQHNESAQSATKEKLVIEELQVEQAKLNLGLRTHTNILADDYIALLIYNGILGGFAHSKLFVNVREKANLAYYASAKLDSHKGIITIQSGIQKEKFEPALEIIEKQLKLLSEGEITKQEFSLTKAVYKNQFKEIRDQPRQIVDFHYHSVLSGKERTLEDYLKEIDEVKIKDIINVANKVVTETVYLLKGQ